MPVYHLGIDDTDSLKKGCTTYVGAKLLEKLTPETRFLDFPNLIRLNPNVPWKSRGNAAICLRFFSPKAKDEILELAAEVVDEYRDKEDEKNQPGIAVLEGEVPQQLKEFGRRALFDVLSIDDALKMAKNFGLGFRTIRGRRGLIGAIAAIGNTLEDDHTFELIVYRKRETWGMPRAVDKSSVLAMDKETFPLTFNNVDYETGRILITPHGPDPILFGIRGESPRILKQALKTIAFSGGERWVIYRSNQGTDAHLINKTKIGTLKPYEAAVIEGVVSSFPKVIRGGHTIMAIRDNTGEIEVAGYEKSGSINRILRSLIPGDTIRAYGGVRLLDDGERLTFNLEKLEVLGLARSIKRNPLCSVCKVRMKAKGKGKGYECEKCGSRALDPVLEEVERKVQEGIYLPPPRSVRHLTKPLQRYGMEKRSWDGVLETFFGQFDAQDLS